MDKQCKKARRTGAVLTPDTNSGQVAASERTVLEELVESTSDSPPAQIHLRPRLPLEVLCELQGLRREDWAVSQERPAIGTTVAFVPDLEEVGEDIRRVEGNEGIRRWIGTRQRFVSSYDRRQYCDRVSEHTSPIVCCGESAK